MRYSRYHGRCRRHASRSQSGGGAGSDFVWNGYRNCVAERDADDLSPRLPASIARTAPMPAANAPTAMLSEAQRARGATEVE